MLSNFLMNHLALKSEVKLADPVISPLTEKPPLVHLSFTLTKLRCRNLTTDLWGRLSRWGERATWDWIWKATELRPLGNRVWDHHHHSEPPQAVHHQHNAVGSKVQSNSKAFSLLSALKHYWCFLMSHDNQKKEGRSVWHALNFKDLRK